MDTTEIIEGLYRQYSLNIQRLCFLYLGDIAASEDAMQDTFLKAYEKYHSFKGKSDIKTWLTRIAINTCKDILRKEKVQGNVVFLDGIQKEQGNITNLESTINKLFVTEAIRKLPQELREVVILFYYQELSTKAISNILRLPRTTIEFRLKKARVEMKRAMEVNFYE